MECRIPPPIMLALTAAAMWYTARVTPCLELPHSLRLSSAALCCLVALALGVGGVAQFYRARTVINPHKPERTSTLVTTGIYRLSRNPMYLGLALVLLGLACYLAAPAALLGPALFITYITRFQIIPEERVLAQTFGASFAQYVQRVRRWI